MHILKDFISIDDLEKRWGLNRKQIESGFINKNKRDGTPYLQKWYATERRARPDGGQSAFVKLAQYLDGCVFDMADVLFVEDLHPELKQATAVEDNEPKMIDGKFIFQQPEASSTRWTA